MCSPHDDISQHLRQVLHIAGTEYLIFRKVILPVPLYIARKGDHNKVYLPTNILSDAGSVLVHQIFRIHVLYGAQENDLNVELGQ